MGRSAGMTSWTLFKPPSPVKKIFSSSTLAAIDRTRTQPDQLAHSTVDGVMALNWARLRPGRRPPSSSVVVAAVDWVPLASGRRPSLPQRRLRRDQQYGAEPILVKAVVFVYEFAGPPHHRYHHSRNCNLQGDQANHGVILLGGRAD